MQRSWQSATVLVGVVAALVAAVSPMAATEPTRVATGGEVNQSHEQALAQDLLLVAKGRGWTYDQAVAQYQAAATIGAIAVKVSQEEPENFVGSAISKTPGGPPTLYLRGLADKFVRDLIEGSDLEIVLADNQPFSFDELEERKLRVHSALEALGFRNVVTGVNISGAGVIPATVAIEPGLPSRSTDILAGVPADLRSSVELTIGDQSGFADTSSFGGMLVTKSGAADATSGWTVKDGNGVTGVTTAGHASGENGIVHAGVTHTFVFKAEHRGEWGDIEWHTTNVGEAATFYATASEIRPALFLEPRAGISLNEFVCQYGRFSNSRDCDLDVFDVSIACTLSGVPNNRLVQMDAITSIPGDSGGGWSLDTRAYGSQKGHCAMKDAWSVADLFDEALGVDFQIFE